MREKVSFIVISLCMAALLVIGGVSTATFSSGPDTGTEKQTTGENHILIEKPKDFSPTEFNLEIVEDYGSTLLIEPDSGGIQLSSSDDFTVLNDNLNKIYLRRETINVNTEPSLQVAEGVEDGYYMIKTIGPVKPEWQETLEEEGEIVDYIPQNTYVMEISSSGLTNIREKDFVQWIGEYKPEYRISPELEDAEGNIKVTISCYRETFQVGTEVEEFGDVIKTGEETLTAIVDSSDIKDIANIKGISWIEKDTEMQLMNADAQWTVQTGNTGERSVWDHGLTGDGEIVGISDTGIDYDHSAFRDPDDNPIGFDHRKIVRYKAYADDHDLDESGHGTHTSGSIAGNDSPFGSNSNDGIAKDARLSFFDVGGDGDSLELPSDYSEIFQPAYDDGARVHSNSWGGQDSSYTSDAKDVDEFMWNNKDMLILYAAGNAGDGASTIGTPATAKNLISVGASGDGNREVSKNDMASFSSRGPTDDGRMKPEIVAPGAGGEGTYGDDDIISADSDGDLSTDNSGYTDMQGTSMACPVTAGAAALAREYFVKGYYPDGDVSNPSAALIKSVLVNSAEEITGSGAYANDDSYPNDDQGFGRIELENALEFSGDSEDLKVYDETSGLGTGETDTYTVGVEDTSQALEITMAYTDYPGSTSSSKALVNNLDLKVTAPDGSVYKGNVYSGKNPGQSTTGGSYDDLNPLENVLRLSPQSGEYTIEVIGNNVPEGPQPYALSLTGGFSSSGGGGNTAPVADFSYSPTDPGTGETVQFTDQSSDSDGSISSHSWDFGDGSTSSSSDPSHNYSSSGTYTVQLTVTDDGGATDTASQDLSVGSSSGGDGYSTVNGGDTSYGEYITNVQFNGINKDSGDDGGYADHTGSVSNNVEPGQTYELSVTLSTEGYSDYASVAIDWDQDQDLSNDQVIEIGNGNSDPLTVTEQITVPSDAAEGETRMRVMQEYDGYHTDPTSDQSYGETEDYTVSVGSNSGGGNTAPVADFSYSPTDPSTGETVQFTDQSSDSDGSISSHSWDFGDGSTSSSADPSHSYSSSGTYTVQLTVTDDEGATDTASQDISVGSSSGGDGYSTVNGGDTSYGEYITNVQFNGINKDSGDDGGYADHTGSVSNNVEPGQPYELSVTLSTEGYSDYASVAIDWDQDQDLSNDQVIEIGNGNSDPLTVTKQITVPSDAAEGETRMRVMQEYDGYHTDPTSDQSYGETEDYTVSVGSNSGGGNTAPVADFSYSPTDPSTGETVQFTDQSSDSDGSISSHSWDFGDGSTSSSSDPSHSYSSSGTYTVQLTVTDDEGATDTASQDISVGSSSGGDGYSTVNGGDTSYGEYITNVQFNGINKDSGDDGGYADHTGSVSNNVEPGQTYELSVTLSTGGYSDYASVAIDWDQDQDLSNDQVIEIGNGNSDPLTVTEQITVPSDAAEGETRMRVMQEYDGYHTDPTSDQSYGETEDYTVSVNADGSGGGSGDGYSTVSGGDTSDGEYITNVQFNGINKDSGDDGGYADHTGSVSNNVEPGQTYELSVTLSTEGYSDYASVAIDWDQDQDLSNDQVIEIGNGNSDPLTVTEQITVPSDAAEGETRMRVMQEYDGYHTDPTSDQSYGETEDYTVSVGAQSTNAVVEGSAEDLNFQSADSFQSHQTNDLNLIEEAEIRVPGKTTI
ncbi:MAG: S8 family serine peptidase [Candidatus Thermoplasmatota archaeon]|nr:S8 family serine peptidase [Candidatus Thermoplasmatota archaeon]